VNAMGNDLLHPFNDDANLAVQLPNAAPTVPQAPGPCRRDPPVTS